MIKGLTTDYLSPNLKKGRVTVYRLLPMSSNPVSRFVYTYRCDSKSTKCVSPLCTWLPLDYNDNGRTNCCTAQPNQQFKTSFLIKFFADFMLIKWRQCRGSFAKGYKNLQ